MPLQLHAIDREQTLAALTKSAFALSGASAVTLRTAEEALLRANPHLAEAGAIRPGATVVVPPIAAARDDGRRKTVAIGREAIFALAMERAELLVVATTAELGRGPAALKEDRALVADKAVRKAFVKAYPDLSEAMAAAPKAFDARAKQADATTARMREALAQMVKDLPKAMAMAGLSVPAKTKKASPGSPSLKGGKAG